MEQKIAFHYDGNAGYGVRQDSFTLSVFKCTTTDIKLLYAMCKNQLTLQRAAAKEGSHPLTDLNIKFLENVLKAMETQAEEIGGFNADHYLLKR